MKQAAHRAAAVVLALLGSAAMAIEQPKFEVVATFADFEVREYAPVIVAETEVTGAQADAGNEAFSRLAGYIFGKNKGSTKLAMTAPVTQAPTEGARIAMTSPVTQREASPGTWRVQFSMPATWTMETLPEPLDDRVSLKVLPARRVAVLRYRGSWSQRNYDEHLARLQAALTREGFVTRGSATWARYDPPWTPWFLKQNEVQLELEPQREES